MDETKEVLGELKDNVYTYAELKLELLKLSTYEKVGVLFSSLSFVLVLVLLAFFAFLFIFLALGFYLNSLFDVAGVGFVIVSFIYLIALLVLYLSKDKFVLKMQNMVIASLMSKGSDHAATK